jgi:hypothetical protein
VLEDTFNEQLPSAQVTAASGGQFRQADAKYLYNLKAKTLGSSRGCSVPA